MQACKLMFLLLLAGTTLPVVADEHRRRHAHEHGAGRLDIAREGSLLHIELSSPAANIVGFEHVPETEADHASLETALTRLEDGAGLFLLPNAAGCRLVDADVATPLHEHRGGEEEQRTVDSPHLDVVDHRAPEDSREHGAETHADITVAWRFSCTHSQELDHIRVQLFDTFPNTHRLRVQFVTGKHQGAADLSASQPVLRF